MITLPIWARPPQDGAYATEAGWLDKNDTMLVSHRGLKTKIEALKEMTDESIDFNEPVNKADKAKYKANTTEESTETDEPIDPEFPDDESLEETSQVDVIPQDLTVIKGLGLKTQERLNASGIFTYKQITELSKEKADELNVADLWIEQAKDLM